MELKQIEHSVEGPVYPSNRSDYTPRLDIAEELGRVCADGAAEAGGSQTVELSEEDRAALVEAIRTEADREPLPEEIEIFAAAYRDETKRARAKARRRRLRQWLRLHSAMPSFCAA